MIDKCKECAQSVNAINGFYCHVVKHYISKVAKIPPCEVENYKHKKI